LLTLSSSREGDLSPKTENIVDFSGISEAQKRKANLALYELEYLIGTVNSLAQAPLDGGCPWTEEQRAMDVLKYLSGEIDEIREELELGSSSPHHALTSELGDLLFCTFLLIRICERDKIGKVSLASAAAFASAKIRRRAPFVFTDEEAGSHRGAFPNTLLTGSEASAIWKRVKAMEKAGLVPICPNGYDYIDGTCLLPTDDKDTEPYIASGAVTAASVPGVVDLSPQRNADGPAQPAAPSAPPPASAAPPPDTAVSPALAGALPQLAAAFAAGVVAGAFLSGR
jgi:NTP pyrophosphatase (non-canonical NTP hydrolase)